MPLPRAASFKDRMLTVSRTLPSISVTYNAGTLVVDRSERVIASNVFEQTDFPTMSKGRVTLLGDGECLDDFMILGSV